MRPSQSSSSASSSFFSVMNPTRSKREQGKSISDSEQSSSEQSTSSGSNNVEVSFEKSDFNKVRQQSSNIPTKGHSSSPATRSVQERQVLPVAVVPRSPDPRPLLSTQTYRGVRRERRCLIRRSSEIAINRGLISSTNGNQLVYINRVYTTTVESSSIIVLRGSDHYQATMNRNPNNYNFNSAPAPQGYDTANGYLSNQQNGGWNAAHQGQFQQQSVPGQYNGPGMFAGSGGVSISQNHAVNHNFYFTSPGYYDVSLQPAAPSNGHGLSGFGAAAQPPYQIANNAHTQPQMQNHGYPGANAFRAFHTAGSAFVPHGTGSPGLATSLEVNRGFSTPTLSSRGDSGFGSTAGTMNQTVNGHRCVRSNSQPHFGQMPGPETFQGYRVGESSFHSSANMSQGSLDNYDDLYEEDQENNSSQGSFSKPAQIRAANFQNRRF